MIYNDSILYERAAVWIVMVGGILVAFTIFRLGLVIRYFHLDSFRKMN
jgi:hypothetical protein